MAEDTKTAIAEAKNKLRTLEKDYQLLTFDSCDPGLKYFLHSISIFYNKTIFL